MLVFNIIVTLILLLWGAYFVRISRFILPEEVVCANYKYVRLTKILIFVAAGVYFLTRCLLMVLLPGSAIHMVGIAVLLAMAVVVSLCLVIISKGSRWQYAAIAYFLVSTVGIGYWANDMITMPGEIYVNENQVEIRGSYTLDIPLTAISAVKLEEQFPNVAYRDNGISFKDINIGYFKLRSGERCFMYLKNRLLPIIHIERRKDMPVYVNCDTPNETIELYNKLDSILIGNKFHQSGWWYIGL